MTEIGGTAGFTGMDKFMVLIVFLILYLSGRFLTDLMYYTDVILLNA
jgi:hypothetical protein